MAKPSVITDTFIAKVAAALKVPGANMHTVARKLGVSPSTVYRASGGKRRVARGYSTKWVASARKHRKARQAMAGRRHDAKRKPHGNAGKRKPRAA